MGLWARLLRWRSGAVSAEPTSEEIESDAEASPAELAAPTNTIALPTEPYVFECQSCGKVFEARRRRARCPECDSTEVALMSE